MTVRPAAYKDVPAIAALLAQAHARSRYAGTVVKVDVKATKALLVNSIQRSGGETIGSAIVLVAEKLNPITMELQLTGVLVGLLDRILGIGDHLYATDLFFVCSPDVDARDPGRLLDGFMSWADQNPRVYEIVLGVTDAVGDPERVGRLYDHRGLQPCGNIWRREALGCPRS